MKIIGVIQEGNEYFFANTDSAMIDEEVKIGVATKDNSQKSVTLYKNSEVVYNGSTNNQNPFNYTYTCDGSGLQTFTAKVDDTMLSKSVEVIDALFVGTMKDYWWYDGASFTIKNVTLDSKGVKWTVPSSNQYLGYRNTGANDLRGKKVKTVVKVNSERNLRLYTYTHNGSEWSTINNVSIPAGSGEITLTSTLPADMEQLGIRIQGYSANDALNEGDVVYIEKWITYISD